MTLKISMTRKTILVPTSMHRLFRCSVILVILFAGSTIKAQNDSESPFAIGVTSGYTLSTANFKSDLRFATSINREFLTGYNAGLVFTYVAPKNLGVQIGLNFIQKGWIIKKLPNTYTRRVNYLELPFLTRIEIGKGNFKLFGLLGPSVSYFHSESEEETVEPGTGDQPFIAFKQPIEHSFDFSICAGIGFSLSTPVGIFQIHAKAGQSLPNFFQYKREANGFITSQNQAANINFAYLIRL